MYPTSRDREDEGPIDEQTLPHAPFGEDTMTVLTCQRLESSVAHNWDYNRTM